MRGCANRAPFEPHPSRRPPRGPPQDEATHHILPVPTEQILGMVTLDQALAAITRRLTEAGIDGARQDARLLAAFALGLEPFRPLLIPERALSPDEAVRLEALVLRRVAREPISHILGRRGFWTLDLEVNADTLAPRPDTETLVEAVLKAVPERNHPWRLLDLGTGTGAILLALLSELPQTSGLGVDLSAGALAVAKRNAQASGLAERALFCQGDWDEGLAGPFDIIVANPPYIPEGDIDFLDPEVARFEPRLALAGGPDGLACYRRLAPAIAGLLAPEGLFALEVGAGQAQAVAAMMAAAGLDILGLPTDLAGIERCVLGRAGRGAGAAAGMDRPERRC